MCSVFLEWSLHNVEIEVWRPPGEFTRHNLHEKRTSNIYFGLNIIRTELFILNYGEQISESEYSGVRLPYIGRRRIRCFRLWRTLISRCHVLTGGDQNPNLLPAQTGRGPLIRARVAVVRVPISKPSVPSPSSKPKLGIASPTSESVRAVPSGLPQDDAVIVIEKMMHRIQRIRWTQTSEQQPLLVSILNWHERSIELAVPKKLVGFFIDSLLISCSLISSECELLASIWLDVDNSIVHHTQLYILSIWHNHRIIVL